jgi:hypothetical protein
MRTCRKAGSSGCSPYPSEPRLRAELFICSLGQPPELSAGRSAPRTVIQVSLMLRARTAAIIVFRLLILVALVTSAGMRANAEEPSPYIVEVSDVAAKVGDPAVLRATLRVRDDYRILKGYNNRLIKLSSFDDGVIFERGMVPAALDEGALVFTVAIRVIKPGKHPINGVFRVGFIHGTDEIAMVSVRLISNVTGTE